MKKLSESIDFFSAKFDKNERERQQKDKDKLISNMKTEMSVMNEKIEKLEQIVARQEQYSRRNCLFLHDIAENKDENTDNLILKTADEKINIELSSSDLELIVLVEKKVTNRNRRAIIVKFVSYNTLIFFYKHTSETTLR